VFDGGAVVGATGSWFGDRPMTQAREGIAVVHRDGDDIADMYYILLVI
jgi:hypothetical protein